MDLIQNEIYQMYNRDSRHHKYQSVTHIIYITHRIKYF